MSKIANMLLDIANQGYTVDDLKQSCINALSPLFEDKSFESYPNK